MRACVRACVRISQPFDVLGVVRAMAASAMGVASKGEEETTMSAPMHYVGLPTTTTLGHAQKMASKYHLFVERAPYVRHAPASPAWKAAAAAAAASDRGSTSDEAGARQQLRFVPLLQWYDSTHICATSHYRDFVFGWRGPPGAGKRLVAKGGFIEDKLSQAQLAEIRAHGMEAHAAWGTFLLDDGTRPETAPKMGTGAGAGAGANGNGNSNGNGNGNGNGNANGSAASVNWLVEHIDGHDVLAVRKFRWAAARTPAQARELQRIVGTYWQRIGTPVAAAVAGIQSAGGRSAFTRVSPGCSSGGSDTVGADDDDDDDDAAVVAAGARLLDTVPAAYGPCTR
jgi:hypothetical protein